MTTNENTSESVPAKQFDVNDAENKKGQMLVIYLPEGSVIVDRTDIDLTNAPQEVIERTISSPAPQQAEVQPPVPPVAPGPQPVQHTLQEVVQIAVQEVMQTNQTIQNSSGSTRISDGVPPVTRRSHRLHLRRRRHFNWIHGINTLVFSYITLVSIVPALLSSFFGMAIYASKVDHPGASISRGDLMICKELPAVGLKVNDVLLVRGENTWRLDVRQVTSNTSDATSSTVATVSTSRSANDRSYVLPVASSVYKVSSVVPKLGYVAMILTSTVTKVLGGLFLLILNLTVHFRRTNKRRLASGIR